MSDNQYDITINYGLKKPWPDLDDDIWGDHLNQNADAIDNLILSLNTALLGYLPIYGGTMLGSLFLAHDPIGGTEASTKGYVDNKALLQVAAVGTPKGSWNATTNVPTLSNNGGGGVFNDAYVVAVAGTTLIDGVSAWNVGDVIYRDTAKWIRLPAAASPSSVFTSISLPNATWSDDASSNHNYNIQDQYGGVLSSVGAGGVVVGTATVQNLLTAATSQLTTIASQTINFPHARVYDDGGDPQTGYNIIDQYGGILFRVDAGGVNIGPYKVRTSTGDIVLAPDATTGHLGIPGSYFWNDHDLTVAFRVMDDWSGVLFQIDADATVHMRGDGSTDGSGYSSDEIAERNARALALSANRGYDTMSARAVYGINAIMGYGQSLMTAYQGWPRISTFQPFDNLMIGQSVRPQGSMGSGNPFVAADVNWVPVGDAAFHPLIATVQDATTGVLIDDLTVPGLVANDPAPGESIDVGATNFWRRQTLQMRGLTADPTRRYVVTNCSMGGRALFQLKKNPDPPNLNIYNRLIDAGNAIKTAATGAGLTAGVTAMLWCQGENDYITDISQSDYVAGVRQLRTDFETDVVTGIFSQTFGGALWRPAWFTYQSGGHFADDSLIIANAQLQMGMEDPGWYLVAPAYPVTDKTGHLDPNGYRWLGMQFGKVLHRVLDLGEAWKPLHPIQITLRGRQILVDFYVPVPPLVFDLVYVINTATDFANKGFSAADASGDLPISQVELVSDTQVLISIGRPASGAAYLSYCDKTHFDGNGCVRDSDQTLADTNYVYMPANGMPPTANIPGLVNQPYPLFNWCCAFRQQIAVE